MEVSLLSNKSKVFAFVKTSFITTVLNEQATIAALLDSILAQTHKPDEIVIVDAGSTDQTQAIISEFSDKSPVSIRLISQVGLNRSQGRNLAIAQAKNQLIVVSDAGCVLDKNWLKLITQPIKNKKVEAVAGFYKAEGKTIFQQCVSPFVAVMPDQLAPKKYLPASRSLSFTKKAWQKAGRYPENLNFCEDLIFACNLKQKTKLIVEPRAIVYWHQAENLFQFFQQIANYASGDVQARYQPHLKTITLVFLRYLIFFFFPWLFFLYLFWPIFKFYRYIRQPLGLIYLPLLQLTADLGVMVGSLKAML
jgi:glycosyltransferase involved in cell wall biosynthesis